MIHENNVTKPMFFDQGSLVTSQGESCVFIDTESGGFSPQLNTLDAIHIIIPNKDSKTIFISPSSQPGKIRADEAVKKNGLSEKFLEDNGVSLENAKKDILDFFQSAFGDRPVAGIAFNAAHDRRFIEESLKLKLPRWFDPMKTAAGSTGRSRMSLDEAYEMETGKKSPRGYVHDVTQDTTMLMELSIEQLSSGRFPREISATRGQSDEELIGGMRLVSAEKPDLRYLIGQNKDNQCLVPGERMIEESSLFLDWMEQHGMSVIADSKELIHAIFTSRAIEKALDPSLVGGGSSKDHARSPEAPKQHRDTLTKLLETFGCNHEDPLMETLNAILTSMPKTQLKILKCPDADMIKTNHAIRLSFSMDYPVPSFPVADDENELRRRMENASILRSRAKYLDDTLTKVLKKRHISSPLGEELLKDAHVRLTDTYDYRLNPISVDALRDGITAEKGSPMEALKHCIAIWPASSKLIKVADEQELHNDPGF